MRAMKVLALLPFAIIGTAVVVPIMAAIGMVTVAGGAVSFYGLFAGVFSLIEEMKNFPLLAAFEILFIAVVISATIALGLFLNKAIHKRGTQPRHTSMWTRQ